MTEYDNTNKGIISKNDRKEKDTHPDITGSINIDGKEYWLNGWHKNRKDGSGTFYSLAVKAKDAPKQDGGNQYEQQQSGAINHQADLDAIPF